MTNILVIGVGPHTRLNHLPSLAHGQDSGLVGTVTGVDLPSTARQRVVYGSPGRTRELPVIVVEAFDSACAALPEAVRETLDAAVARERIGAVVVATEPSVHLPYARWALEHGLSVLLDKPLSVHARSSVDPAAAAGIATDYDTLMAAYEQARRHDPNVLVSVASQRRYHPAFQRIRELIAEVAEQTNCPITSIQSFHSDGQWRLPHELVDLPYHGYDRGYGKAAHSGYHFFDIVPWLLAAGERPGKELDEVDVHAHVARPADVLAQLTVADHERLFPGLAERNPYSEVELNALTEEFGEVDAFVSMAYKSRGRTMTLGSINLVHHGFSQRGTLEPTLASLYKGNGRVRHETHIIEQGPFQAIHFHCLQTLHEGGPSEAPTALGGEDHIEIHIFRNDRLHKGWKKHISLDFAALTTGSGPDAAMPTQKTARRRAMTEFLQHLAGRLPRHQTTSDLADHRRPAALMAGAYLSMAQQFTGGSPHAALDFRTAKVQSYAQLEAAR